MSPKRSSMQTSTPFANAHNSLETAENAVSQAQSHPSGQMVTQAQNALAKADLSCSAAERQAQDNPVATDSVTERLQDLRERLSEIDY